MKYALVNGERQEAQPKLPGKCICCDNPVIAKCGTVRVSHWAHRGMCDPCWEGETEWHREWKGQFPKDWQEVIHFAENGEKHIADVKTDHGYVIEFQHSYIKPEERQSREFFYKKMIWIIDGTKRSRDKDKFIDVWENHSLPLDVKVEVRRLFNYYAGCALLRDWLGSNVPVFFDFGEDMLWGLLSKTIKKGTHEYAFIIKRDQLLSFLLPASTMSLETLLKSLTEFITSKEALHSLRFELQHTSYYHQNSSLKRL